MSTPDLFSRVSDRVCVRCLTLKPYDSFRKRKQVMMSGKVRVQLSSYCGDCEKLIAKAHYKMSKDKGVK